MGDKFAALTLICVLISTAGLAACTCQEDCQTDRTNCDDDCDSTQSTCYDTCSSQRQTCDDDCDSTYNSCMSGCGGDPDCEMMCDGERMMCKDNCGMTEMSCMMDCDSDHSNCQGGCSDTYDACIAACPPPPSITHTKGRYWVNHTWVLNCTDESVPTSYNVSINQTWHNETLTRWYNNSGLNGGVWSNAIVMAWNATTGTICSVTLSEGVYLPPPLPPAPVGTGSTWDFFWVNHTWAVGSDGQWAGDTDSFNVSIETHWINGTTKNEWNNGSLTTFYNNSLDGEYGWSNITVWAYNDVGGLSSTYIYQNVEVPIFVPPTPVNPQSTSGRFWVNHTWSPGTGHYTDSYNVSLESDGWHNGTLTAYYKEQMSSNGWSNITVYAYNNTHHELSALPLTDNVLISWTNDIFVNTSGWWRDGDVFNATASRPISTAIDNVVTGDSIRVYDGTYHEAAILYGDDVTITPVSGRPVIHPDIQQSTLLIAGDNATISGFEFSTPYHWAIYDGCALIFYGTEGSTASDNDFRIRQTILDDVSAIQVANSDNCTIIGGTLYVDREHGIIIDKLSSGTTVTGTTIMQLFDNDPRLGIRIERDIISPHHQHNTISGNSIQETIAGIEIIVTNGGNFDDTNVWSGNSVSGSTTGIEINASGGSILGGADAWASNSVSGCTYGVKHTSSSIIWNGSASSNTYDHYFSGDTSGSVIQNPPSLANLYLADAGSACTIINTDGRMFDVCGARHEYIDDLAYAHPNGTFSRHISDSSPLELLNLQFYSGFTITPASASVSVANIEFFGSACDATGGHDVEVDVASSTPDNEVRFDITGDSSWINDYVDMDISGTFVKREKANYTSFVSILYTGGFSSHHFEFDEIYIPGGGGGTNPILDPSFECQNYEGNNPDITTFCNWSQSKSCDGTSYGGCRGGEGSGCEWQGSTYTGECGGAVEQSSAWHTDGDYSALLVATYMSELVDDCHPYMEYTIITTINQSVDLTGISTLQFDARLRMRGAYSVTDCDFPGPDPYVSSSQLGRVYVGGTLVWTAYRHTPYWGAYEGYHSYDYTNDFLERELDVSAYSGVQNVQMVAYVTVAGDEEHSDIDGWLQTWMYFDNMDVLYSVQPPENLLYEACPYWVNHTWDTPTGGAVIDSYNVSVNDVWHNGTTDTFYNDATLTDWRQWSNISVYSYNTTEGRSPGSSSATVQLVPAIPVPIDLTHSQGHIWIRHAWAPGSSFSCLCVATQSYNVSVNDVWYNGTTDTFYDDTGLAYEEWSNITVYSYNNDAGIISNNPITQNLKVDSPKPPTPVGGTGSWGFFWVDHAWSAGSEPGTSCTDSYNYSVTTHLVGGSPSTVWYNDSTNTNHNNPLGGFGWSNITVWAWNDNVTAGLSEDCIYQNVEVPEYTPPTPTYIHVNTDPNAQVWANFSWACDVGGRGLADSFNISVNSVWHNGTTLCNNDQPVPEDSDFEDNTLMGWTTSGSYAWTPTAYGYESTYAIRDGFTGTATGSSSVWKTITLDDYGTLYFDCKLNDGTLTVYNGSETLYEITGTHDWQSVQINLTPGTCTIKFTYQRPASPTPENHVWVDNVAMRQRVHGWYLASGFVDADIDVVVWAWNDTYGGISEGYTNDSAYIGRIPRTPCNISHTTGWYWVNYTWEPVENHDDSYNVSLKGVWHNNTLTRFYNDSGRMTDWGQCSEITVYSYNSTLDSLSNGSISDSGCLSPTLTQWNDHTDGPHTIMETFDQLTEIEFTCSSDAEMAMWNWTGVDSNGSTTNSKTTNGTLLVYEWKDYVVTVKGTNATGTVTDVKTWHVTLVPPDDWYDPNYAFRKKVLVNNTCWLGGVNWSTTAIGYHATVHLDTRMCAWDDCWDIFCYAPMMSAYFPENGLRWYTPRAQGYPDATENEEIYVELAQLYGCGWWMGDPPWELWIYYHNPSRTDKPDCSTKYHCQGYGEILHPNSTLTYDMTQKYSWRSLLTSTYPYSMFYGVDDGEFNVGKIYVPGWGYSSGWRTIATTYPWFYEEMNPKVPYILSQPGNNSLHVSSTCNCWHGDVFRFSTPVHKLTVFVCDPRNPYIIPYYSMYPGDPYPTHYIDANNVENTQVSRESTLRLIHAGGFGSGGPAVSDDCVFGDEGGSMFGATMRAYETGVWSMHWEVTKCDLTFSSTPDPVNVYDCVTVDDGGAPTALPDPAIIVYDEKGNLVSGLTYMIYNKDDEEVYSPWAVDGDGVIYFNDPTTRNLTFVVRTHEGMYAHEFTVTNGSIVNTTIPITYNIAVNAFDESGRRLDDTICTISEYTPRDPGFFWGLSRANSTRVRMKDLSSFGMCDMTVEKAGYHEYNVSGLNWTTQSTMIKDYKHDAILTTE